MTPAGLLGLLGGRGEPLAQCVDLLLPVRTLLLVLGPQALDLAGEVGTLGGEPLAFGVEALPLGV
jgi:hypothetical protein